MKFRKNKPMKESYSDIWSDNAWDAYDIALEYLGAEGLCEALAKAMGTDELASNLKYIFRVNEIPFMDDEEFDESYIKQSQKFKSFKLRKNFVECRRKLHEQDVEIEVKNKGILEVPEGKNVDDLPMSHFEKLVKKHGLSKITKALNNLQVWNKNDDKKLSKWAGNMIDKLTKKYGKNESTKYRRRSMKESPSKSYWKYSVLDPVFDRDENDDTYLSKYDIRRVKLIPCDNPDECYDDTYSAVCDYEYPYDEFYGTKQDAYDMLLTSWNNSTFERIHDI